MNTVGFCLPTKNSAQTLYFQIMPTLSIVNRVYTPYISKVFWRIFTRHISRCVPLRQK